MQKVNILLILIVFAILVLIAIYIWQDYKQGSQVTDPDNPIVDEDMGGEEFENKGFILDNYGLSFQYPGQLNTFTPTKNSIFLTMDSELPEGDILYSYSRVVIFFAPLEARADNLIKDTGRQDGVVTYGDKEFTKVIEQSTFIDQEITYYLLSYGDGLLFEYRVGQGEEAWVETVLSSVEFVE